MYILVSTFNMKTMDYFEFNHHNYVNEQSKVLKSLFAKTSTNENLGQTSPNLNHTHKFM